jgi:sulfur relay (sulfurtransferase) DsrC/TusE family protein
MRPQPCQLPVATDNEGYLLEPSEWNEDIALKIAGMRKPLKLLLDL